MAPMKRSRRQEDDGEIVAGEHASSSLRHENVRFHSRQSVNYPVWYHFPYIDNVNSKGRNPVSLRLTAAPKHDMRGTAARRRSPATGMRISQIPKRKKALPHHPAHNMKSCETADLNIWKIRIWTTSALLSDFLRDTNRSETTMQPIMRSSKRLPA